MKKFILILFGALLFGCNQSSTKKETDEHAGHESAAATELTLNNGAKWKADSITNHNAVDLITIANMFRVEPFPSVDNYQILGNDLNKGLNKMLSECKMTGPAHDALHKWLEPILKGANELKNVTDTSVGRAAFKSVDKQIDNYHNYFE